MSEPDSDSTVPVTRQQFGEQIQTTCELRIRDVEGETRILPITRTDFECRLGEGCLKFTYAPGELRFRNLTLQEPAYVDGEVVAAARLEVGGFLEFAGHRILYWDNGQPAALLRGCSSPYSGEIWPLGPGQHTMGRPGRRHNAIRLDHPTVSREHATVSLEDGHYFLLAESTTNLVCVAGQAVEPGARVGLAHGDIIELGEVVLRFHNRNNEVAKPTECGLIRVRSLGGFQVEVAGQVLADKEWKTQQIKWLFAHLAYLWGRPLSLETILEELWPDFAPEKSRNNLNYSVSTLRQIIRNRLPEDLRSTEVLMRSSSTLQLNQEILDQHDVVRLQRYLSTASSLKAGVPWEQQAEKAILEYGGPYLNECYLDWVWPIRQSLEVEVLELGQRLLQAKVAQSNWESIIPLASHILKIDPVAQWACLSLMQALAHSGQPGPALKVFDTFKDALLKELGQEPDEALLREQIRIQLLT